MQQPLRPKPGTEPAIAPCGEHEETSLPNRMALPVDRSVAEMTMLKLGWVTSAICFRPERTGRRVDQCLGPSAPAGTVLAAG